MPPKCTVCNEHYWSGHPCKCGRTPENQAKTEQPVELCGLEWVDEQLLRAEMAASVDINTFKKALSEARSLYTALQTAREVSDGWQALFTKLRDSKRESSSRRALSCGEMVDLRTEIAKYLSTLYKDPSMAKYCGTSDEGRWGAWEEDAESILVNTPLHALLQPPDQSRRG